MNKNGEMYDDDGDNDDCDADDCGNGHADNMIT